MRTGWNLLPSEDNNPAVFSASYFPCTAYIAMLSEYASATVDGMEHFVKQSHRNRTYILSANGILPLTVPVTRESREKIPACEVRICYKTPWQRNHIRAISSAYGKSPYFYHYFPEIENILTTRHELLIDLCVETMQFLVFKLGLKTVLTRNDVFNPCVELDYRREFSKQDMFSKYRMKKYFQCFSDRFGFQSNPSALDLLFNMGPESMDYLCFE